MNFETLFFQDSQDDDGSTSSGNLSYVYDGSQPRTAGEWVMSDAAHGTCDAATQSSLRWDANREIADHICCYNRHYAESAGYWQSTSFPDAVAGLSDSEPVEFFDSVTGQLLFTAPVGRTWLQFLTESEHHGWPSFRDQEVNWANVRTLEDGETVSVWGTHLGHNLPDGENRYCINLVSVAGFSLPPPQVTIFLGAGCFWHVQHELIAMEQELFGRSSAELSAVSGYAGGNGGAVDGLVCYHNAQHTAYYGDLGHAEVVSLSVPLTYEAASAVAEVYLSVLLSSGERNDPMDRGPEYRSLVGFPGGTESFFFEAFVEAAARLGSSVQFQAGAGSDADTLGTGRVWVMEAEAFPAFQAEVYHQFHDDFLSPSYPAAYHHLKQDFLGDGRIEHTGCPSG